MALVPRLALLILAAVASSLLTIGTVARAQSYQIDCAILLCLSGGWPSSVPCVRARAEFIRRITPWPVEPPLQIWRCPMGVSSETDSPTPADRRWDASLDMPLQSQPLAPHGGLDLGSEPRILRHDSGGAALPLPDGFAVHLAQNFANEDGRADFDISGPEFNFVRSIRVYMVRGQQRESGREGEEECNRSSSARVGRYGVQGDYAWNRSSLVEVPRAYARPSGWGRHCPTVWFRSVFVDWRDYEGNYGWERVDY